MKLLVPVNGSPAAMAAVRHAAHAARAAEDVVLLANIQPRLNAHAGRFVSRRACDAMREERSARAFHSAAALLRVEGVRFETIARAGRIGPAIASLARETGADEVVLGMRRRTNWWQGTLSPVPGILGAADVPVTVISTGRAGPMERYGLPACVGLGLTLLVAAD